MKFIKWNVGLCVLMVVLITNQLSAQSALDVNDQATVAFDLNLDQIKNSKLAKGVGIDAVNEILRELQEENPIEDLDIRHAKRIRGAVNLPDSMEVFEQMDRGQSVLEFLVEMEFDDEQLLQDFKREIKSEFQRQDVGGNREFYKPVRGPEAVRKIGVEFASGNRIMIGTDKYFEAGLNNVNTARLSRIWSSAPNHAFKAAVDIQGSSKLIKQVVEEIKNDAPRDMAVMVAGYFDLVNNASDLVITMDLDSDHLLTLNSNAVGEDAADELHQGLDSLMALAKFSGRSWAKMMPVDEPEIQEFLIGFFNSLKAERNGNVVSIKIPKPAKMDELIVKMAAKAKVAAERAARLNDVRFTILAMLNYESAYKTFPVESANGSKNISWRVRILPFMEQNALGDQMDVNESWDSETNRKALEKMPKIFGADGRNSNIVWVVPENGRPKTFGAIRDGSSNTIALMKINDGVPWTQAKDISAKDAVKYIKGLKDGEAAIVSMYDGSVHQIDNSIDAETLKNLLNPNDGNVIDWGWADK